MGRKRIEDERYAKWRKLYGSAKFHGLYHSDRAIAVKMKALFGIEQVEALRMAKRFRLRYHARVRLGIEEPV